MTINTPRKDPEIPSGWYHVAYSEQVPAGAVIPVSIFGEETVLWRSEDNQPKMFSAYCPHLGAHIGYGGAVEGMSITCPFHGWRFDAKGQCIDVPYSKSPPPRACLKKFDLVEMGGRLLGWHSHVGLNPYWLPIGTFSSSDPSIDWNYDSFRHTWNITSTVEDMVENVADVVHVSELHGLASVLWKIDESPYRRRMSSNPDEGWEVTVTYEGPGLGYSHFCGPLEILQISSLTPIDLGHIRLEFEFRVRSDEMGRRDRVMARMFVRNMIRILDEDVVIWNHKKHLERPQLLPEDRSISEFRKWFRGTQSDSSTELPELA
jgi:phenylpropionate dioxygenase-like ring-hydroxylating dioxygenase large terminal subunit